MNMPSWLQLEFKSTKYIAEGCWGRGVATCLSKHMLWPKVLWEVFMFNTVGDSALIKCMGNKTTGRESTIITFPYFLPLLKPNGSCVYKFIMAFLPLLQPNGLFSIIGTWWIMCSRFLYKKIISPKYTKYKRKVKGNLLHSHIM